MKNHLHTVKTVAPGSIGEELGIEPGDRMLSINGMPVEDVFDYRYLCSEELVTVLIQKPDGEEWELEIEKDSQEDLGLTFENGLMDSYRSCRNKCIFCFIDQMPPGMRDTLYFKDDDARLSFLQGNYVTLTNMSDHDIERIIQYHMEPINISFHTMNPALRCRMLNNRFAGEALKKADRLYEAGIHMNGQIVLCKGINDGEELEYSIRELARYMPLLESVSVVPVGLTKYREGLTPLAAFTKEDACRVLDTIERWQDVFREKYGIHGIHAGDEWYLLAERALPEEERYDGYLQLENGVGMLTLLEKEFLEALEACPGDALPRRVSVATGLLAAPFIERLAGLLGEKYLGLQVQVFPIRNDFFGERITVSGLLTGQDLKKQLLGKDLGQRLLLPCNILKSGETVFLDDMTVAELESALQTEINIVKSSGQALAAALLLQDAAEHLHTDEVNKYE
ncbi:MAG TPA: DUF512 domain-containing protein [Candidatus Limivivens intestinipullorum]|uniref:DUF512 domain-containing protein n=1 Tax=Candidatus Limivivens intestinipullorum TaxID=2840858 RepID=A0A9D1ER99_9FIRM|nr:DUF512 domain-containing protein [Candidatus Limivivens intestinipullorum]